MARQYGAWLGLQRHPPRTGIAYVAVRVVVYIVALALMTVVYGTKERGLFMAPPVALVAAGHRATLRSRRPGTNQQRDDQGADQRHERVFGADATVEAA